MTGGDFELKPVGAIGPGSQQPGLPGGAPGAARPGRVAGSTFGSQATASGSQAPAAGSRATGSRPATGQRPSQGEGGEQRAGRGQTGEAGEQAEAASPFGQRAAGQLIGGVRSKSKAQSIRELNGRTRYDQWEFVYVPYNPNPQTPAAEGARPGQQPRTPTQKSPGTTPATQRPGSSGASRQ